MFNVLRAPFFVAPLLAAPLLLGSVAGCGRSAPIAFSPFTDATSVVVNNARGAFHSTTVRDRATIVQLIEIMNRYRDGWSPRLKSRFGTGPAQACGYGIGFYTDRRWLGGMSIETDGTTVARSQFGTGIAYKPNTRMGSELLAVLHLKS